MDNISYFILYSLLSAGLMIMYEFCTGLTFKLFNKEVPWVYKKYSENKFRSISAFSFAYFMAWIGLGMLSYLVFEVVL